MLKPDELVARVETIQQGIFTLQHVVQDELVKSLQAIALAKGFRRMPQLLSNSTGRRM